MTHQPRRRWGPQTALALANFPISGEPMPRQVVEALLVVKAEAAKVNVHAGVVSPLVGAAIVAACEALLADPRLMAYFPVDVFQTGSGTSTNMNANEVVAIRAGFLSEVDVHPNDHVNASQSSNDVIPTAIRMAAAGALVNSVIPSFEHVRVTIHERALQHAQVVKLGRTHLMDAVPLTFGQELQGWARMVHLAAQGMRRALPQLYELPVGGTAVGTGLNAPPGFGEAVVAALRQRTGLPWREATDHFEAQSSQLAILDASAACRSAALALHKVAGDVRLLGSGPHGGFGEVQVPELQAGSSIMPGKVNPVIPEAVQQVAAQIVGNDAAIMFATTASTLQLNTAMPVIARNIMSTVTLLAAAATVLDQKCLQGLRPNVERMRELAERSTAIATVLVPRLGYNAATRVARAMDEHDLDVAEALTHEGFGAEVHIDLLELTERPGATGPPRPE